MIERTEIMNELQVLNIEGVDCYEKDGVAYLKLENVARGLGFVQIQNKNGIEYTSIRWETIYKYLTEIGFPQQTGENIVAGSCNGNYRDNCPDYIPENVFYRLAMKAKNETAEKFQAKVADEIIPSIRRNGSYSTYGKSAVEQGIAVVKFIADDLRVNTASRILMYENYCKDCNIPTNFLPKYELNGNRQLKSLSALLKENDCGMSAKKFNLLLMSQGYLEERERPSSKGSTKKFKALTEKGLKYGENAVSTKNQKEVQPIYYCDTFLELYNSMVK
jgi:prophage antirepressor-like protein